ncbi:hypothetical protein FM104_14095 [Microbacterium esteraromaticum]|uniref:Uncharacterized protein n=2 Tax=Microbacterium esteraromaticum TaxID=57043 RepID=A0A1R4KMB1_9MICO|nr:hypothetical protein FM104_14095 [Microbacterium esteraromaticum]
MRHITLRAVAGAAAIAITLPLSGCISASIPDQPVKTPEPGPTQTTEEADATEAPITPPDSSVLPPELSFADGAALAPGTIAQWGDGLMMDDNWGISKADDGNGGWEYKTADGTCTATFWQGAVFDMTATEDKEASDFVLGAILGIEPSVLGDKADTGAFTYMTRGNTDVEQRFAVGSEPNRSWVVAARGFAQLESAVYVIVDCASDQAGNIAGEVFEKSPVVIG